MIKNNKWKLIISSIFILLPMLFAIPVKKKGGIFAENFISVFFVLPAILLAMHVFLLFIESRQKHEQGRKITNIIFSLIPIMSIYVGLINLAIAFEFEFSITVITAPFLAILFIVLGNYMPKTRQNHTFGIKIKWTLENEENWNATHRFSGKLWVAIGVLMLFTVFLPDVAFIVAFLVLTSAAIIPSIIYSYRYHKQQILTDENNQNTTDEVVNMKKNRSKTSTIIGIVAAVLILGFVAIIMFSCKLNFTLGEEKLLIDTGLIGDKEIKYSDIESIEYREGGVDGVRVAGVGSAKLLLGWFKNDEFGTHLRYTTTGRKPAIVLKVSGEWIVIGEKDNDATLDLYENLLERSGLNEGN